MIAQCQMQSLCKVARFDDYSASAPRRYASRVAAAMHTPLPSWVNSLHYRTATLASASPQLAESIRAAKRFRVVPLRTPANAAPVNQESTSVPLRYIARTSTASAPRPSAWSASATTAADPAVHV